MAETKYGKYVLREPRGKPNHPEVTAPLAILKAQEDWGKVPFGMNWECISEPFLMIKEPHAHDHDQFLCFMGGDITNIFDFQAEVELSLGEEGEKHIINSATIVYIPGGLIHCPLNFKRVDKPIMFHDIFLSSEYKRV